MPKFRKKPVVIEAFQMTKERRGDNSEWPNWLKQAWNGRRGKEGSVWPAPEFGDVMVVCGVLGGYAAVYADDWILCGTQGEIYPCKPDIFEQTYKPFESVEQPCSVDGCDGTVIWDEADEFGTCCRCGAVYDNHNKE